MTQKVFRRFDKHSSWLLAQPGVLAANPEHHSILVFVDATVTEDAKETIQQKIGNVPVHFQVTQPLQAELDSPVPPAIRQKFWAVHSGIDDTALYEGDGGGREPEANIYIARYCQTPEQRRWMEQRNLTIESMACGRYRLGDEAAVMAIYQDWNHKLGVEWYHTEPLGQALAQAVQQSLGPVTFR